jgi:hypothetical protein
VGDSSLQHSGGRGFGPSRDSKEYREYYPGLDARWPKHRWRLYWTWAFSWTARRARKRQTVFQNPEWRAGHHLPSTTRVYYSTHMYTRLCVPITEDTTRVWYYHYAQPKTALGKFWEKLHFRLYHNWDMNVNFSTQDKTVLAPSYYDKPEKLSVSDVATIEWRKLLMRARGITPPAGGVDDTYIAEELAAGAPAHVQPDQAAQATTRT